MSTFGTGPLIVRDAVAKGHSVVALVRSMSSAGLPDAGIIEGDARNEATIARALDGCDATWLSKGSSRLTCANVSNSSSKRKLWDERIDPHAG